MNSAFFSKILLAVSKERLGAYYQDGADEITALSRYLWNIAVCESLYSPLQMVEIALRNAAHAAFTHHYGTDTWYDDAPLNPFGQRQLGIAKQNLAKRNKPVTPGHVVAELHFGFWTAFFNRGHNKTGMGAALLKHGFKNCPKSFRKLQFQDRQWQVIRRLRNRVFHHERIIHWKDLPKQHMDLIGVVGWISPELEDMSLRLDRFINVYQKGITPWMAAISTHWPKEEDNDV